MDLRFQSAEKSSLRQSWSQVLKTVAPASLAAKPTDCISFVKCSPFFLEKKKSTYSCERVDVFVLEKRVLYKRLSDALQELNSLSRIVRVNFARHLRNAFCEKMLEVSLGSYLIPVDI